MLDMLPVLIALAIFCVAVAGFAFTVWRALHAVQKEDIIGLKNDIAHIETRLDNSRKEDMARFEQSRREDAARFEKGISDLNAKFDTAIAQINGKFDRYLFGKLEKTDDAKK